MTTELNYFCSPEWHLAQLKRTPLAGILYSFAVRIAKHSRHFHGSVVGLAEYFGVSRWKVQKAIKALVGLGFFELVRRDRFSPSVYHVVQHSDWKGTHPGCCAVKRNEGQESDPLVVAIWNVSGSRVKCPTSVAEALREIGLTDDELATAFQTFFEAEGFNRAESGQLGRAGFRSMPFVFLKWLEESATRRLDAQRLTRSRAEAESEE
jgi:hypothetical protein